MLCIATEHFLIMTIDSAHKELVDRVEKRLERRSYPRLQMMIIVSLTGATGLLVSATLLRLGLTDMGLRYPVSVLIAYCAFLVLLWLWIRKIAGDFSNLTPEQLAVDESADAALRAAAQVAPLLNPAQPVGELGGVRGLSAEEKKARANALGHVSRVRQRFTDAFRTTAGDEDNVRSRSEAVDESGKLLIPLMVLLLFIGMGLASFYVVATAPALMAELLVDSTLSYSLYKRLVRTEEPSWLRAAVSRTLWPLALTTIFVSIMGWAMGDIAPGAHTLGEALAYTPPVAASTAP